MVTLARTQTPERHGIGSHACPGFKPAIAGSDDILECIFLSVNEDRANSPSAVCLMFKLFTLSPRLLNGRPRPGMNNANVVNEKYL
jgi:hypothetical protein